MQKRLAVAWLAAGMLGGVAWAGDNAPVYCGSVCCRTLKTPAHGQSPEQRADGAMSVLNKYLGSRTGRFTTAARGSEVQILLNGEALLLVTPADAKSEQARSVNQLAAGWLAAFARAFDATRAQK
jgi:hypothetical protein